MKVIYEAFDGTHFEDIFDCEAYEFRKLVLERTNVKVYNKRNKLLTQLNIDSNYNTDGTEYRVVVKDEQDLDDIRKVIGFVGAYVGINSIGTWVYREDYNGFGEWVLLHK